MSKSFTATASIAIKADAEAVWDALTNPRLIKQYLFGTEAASDWKAGSSITYKGVWEGKPYEDKGRVVEVVPNRLLRTTYWSAASGRADRPENYNNVTYRLSEADGQTTVTVEQDNNPTQEAADHATANWATVLQSLKAVLEK